MIQRCTESVLAMQGKGGALPTPRLENASDVSGKESQFCFSSVQLGGIKTLDKYAWLAFQ